jgi:hypothetical protein
VSEHPADLSHDLDDVNLDAGVTAAGAPKVESPKLAPEQGLDAKGTSLKKDVMSPSVSKLMIMAPQRERSWEDFVNNEPQPEPPHVEATHHRHASAVVAVIALAAITGIVGGSFATAGIGRLLGPDTSATASTTTQTLQDHIARLDAEIGALKGEGERATKQSASARAKFAERLDRIEKAQAEPAAKLARLSESVEKLRIAPPTVVAAATPAPAAAPTPTPAPAAVASLPSKDITGSINAPVPTQAKPEVARLPLVEGWRLLDVAQGGATIESHGEVFEVYAGDPVPGLGRVDAIRKQDGRWTVVTTRGLIVAR